MKRALVLLLVLVGCAAASGYDPKRYANNDAGAPDPDTAPLPPQPKTTIPDPKQPPAPTPPPPAVEDAGPPPDAGKDAGKPKAK